MPSMDPTAAPGTILLVEDEPQIRGFATVALQRSGYRVIEADSAEMALELTEDQDTPIDLLLTDVILPRMDGRDLASRLHQRRPEMRVLFMSGYSDSWTAMPSDHPERNEHLIEKPFSPQGLLTMIRQVLGAPGPCAFD
jgi:hypothetical protein